ncbi:MAG: WD40/YVTN/BNR-like repeat-containing protein [Planctomycetota bacterium]
MTNPENANEVTAITTSPSPSNVYRSSDAGVTWSKIGEIPYPYVYDVSAFDFSTLYAISSSRCFASTDGGATWTESQLPSSAGWAYRVCVHPTDSSKIYAAGYKYDSSNRTDSMVFFKSSSGGRNWSTSQFFVFDSFYPRDMAISRSNPSVMYIAGYKQVGTESFGALFKTSDGGDTWTDISSYVDSERYNYFYSVAIDSTDEEKVYVGGTYFYRATRTGRTEVSWTRSPTRLYTYAIGIDPLEPSRIYTAGYESIAVSTNYGLSWSVRSNCVKSSGGHIAVAPADPSKVYVSTSAGFYRSGNSGSNWDEAHEGIYAARIAALAVGPSMVIAQNSGYLMAHGRGRRETWEDVVTPESCGTVCDILINPDNPDTVLILEGYG